MHPDTTYHLAKIKMNEDLAWAERQRRARLARPTPSPDAIAFEHRDEHLSFASRVRALLGALRPTSDLSGHAAGA